MASPVGRIPLREFLLLRKAQQVSSNRWLCLCPAHDDHDQSLAVDVKDGKPLLTCRVGCDNRSQIIPKLVELGQWPLFVDGPSNLPPITPTFEGFKAQAVPAHLVAEVPRPSRPGHVWVSRHEYRDAEGNLLGFISRLNTTTLVTGKKVAKIFVPQFWNGERWLERHPVPKPLYGLPSLALQPQAVVLLVEGEKVADAAQVIFPDLVVVSVNGGAGALSHNDLAPLRGRQVVVWCDADQGWRTTATSWLQTLKVRGVQGVKLVQLPDRLVAECPKWDLADAVPEWLKPRELLEGAKTPEEKLLGNLIETLVTEAQVLEAFMSVGDRETRFVVPGTTLSLSSHAFDDLFRHVAPNNGSMSRQFTKSKNTADQKCTREVWDPGKPQTFIDERSSSRVWNVYAPPQLKAMPGDVGLFLEFVSWLMSPEDGVEFLCRSAFMVQCPTERPSSAFLLKGNQGVGKSMLLQSLVPLVGPENHFPITSRDILGSWNDAIARKRLLTWNEAAEDPRSRVKLYDAMKEMISEDVPIEITQRYRDNRSEKLYAHIFIASNEDLPLALPTIGKERRFYVAECVPLEPRAPEFYAELAEWLADNQGQLLHFLENYGWESFKPKATPRLTLAKARMVEASMPVGERDLLIAARDGNFPFNGRVQILKTFAANCMRTGIFSYGGNQKYAGRELCKVLDKLKIPHEIRRCMYKRQTPLESTESIVLLGSPNESREEFEKHAIEFRGTMEGNLYAIALEHYMKQRQDQRPPDDLI